MAGGGKRNFKFGSRRAGREERTVVVTLTWKEMGDPSIAVFAGVTVHVVCAGAPVQAIATGPAKF